MRRLYADTVTQGDGSSDIYLLRLEPTSPARTSIPSANQVNKPARLDI